MFMLEENQQDKSKTIYQLIQKTKMMLNVTSLSYKTTFNRKLLGKLGHTHHPFCADEIQL